MLVATLAKTRNRNSKNRSPS